MCLHLKVYLHSKNIIHRDIKAANILLTETGQCKLGMYLRKARGRFAATNLRTNLPSADFGVSGQMKDEFNKKNTVTGTPLWMVRIEIVGAHTTAHLTRFTLKQIGARSSGR